MVCCLQQLRRPLAACLLLLLPACSACCLPAPPLAACLPALTETAQLFQQKRGNHLTMSTRLDRIVASLVVVVVVAVLASC